MPAVLRQYVVEAQLTADSNFSDRLRLGLVRTLAMIELLLEKRYEAPQSGALHLSTLVHQILSVIAECGGAHASKIFSTLCQKGPFRQVTISIFFDVLRAMGRNEARLIEQAEDGTLLLGSVGEKLVEHYSFYAVFQTLEEYRLIAGGRELGSMPVDNIIAPGMMLIFSGRRWEVAEVHDRDRVIVVIPAKAGVPPKFGGEPGIIHDQVIERMFSILQNDNQPIYMDKVSLKLLEEARANYRLMNFQTVRIAQLGEHSYILATRCGTIKTTTLALALRSYGFSVHAHDGFLEVTTEKACLSLNDVLTRLKNEDALDLFSSEPNLVFEKFHQYLTPYLLQLDALSSRLDENSLRCMSSYLVGE